MKKLLLTLFLLCVAVVLHAVTFDNGDFTYTVISDNTVNLTGYSSSATTTKTSITIPGYVWYAAQQKRMQVTGITSGAFSGNQYLQYVSINYGVKTIASNAFYNCQSLSSVWLPSSITSIGNYAFSSTSLRYVYSASETMPTINSTTFNSLHSTGTRYWVAPTTTGQTAANANSYITAQFTVNVNPKSSYDITGNLSTSSTMSTGYYIVTEPTSDPNSGSVVGIGKCKLIAATPASNNTTGTLKFRYNEEASQDNINYYVTEIDRQAFSNNTTFKILDMSEDSKVEKIGVSAFYNSALTSAIITAKNVDNFAFDQSSNLTSVKLYGTYEDEGVKTLGAYCFRGTGLTTVYIPSSVTSYGSGAFCACPNLDKITCSSDNSYYAADATTGWLYNKSFTTLYQVGGGNYGYRDQFKTTCTSIGGSAFWGNTKYTKITIPYGVTSIGNDAFYNSALTELLIPSSVTSFSTYCLRNMTALKDLYINKPTIPSTLTDVSTCLVNVPTGGRLHVPRGAINNYASNSRWNAVFSAGKYESAYDTYLYSQGNYIFYTVTSTSTYSDPVATSSSTNGQVKVVKGYRAYYPNNALSGDLVFPTYITLNGKTYMVTEVDRETFRDKTAVTSVSGGAAIKTIGPLSFAGMTGMTGAFNIPNVIEFGDSCLFNTLATSINLGSRLQRIGIMAFRGCSKLTGTIYVPATVTSIGRYAWWDCNSILEIILRSTNYTSVGAYLFNQSYNINLYAQLNQYLSVESQTSSWLTSTGLNRHLLPCYTATSEWSVISVPVSDNVCLPLYGEYYYSSEFDRATMTLGLTQLNNSNGIKGYVGMLVKGTVGQLYRFRRPVENNYTVINPSVNYIKGVQGSSQSLSASQCVYYLDTSVNQFRKWTNTSSPMTVYSGGGYLQLSSSVIGSTTANVHFVPGESLTSYGIYIAGVQVNEVNCSDLTFIDGVSGTVYYTPSTKTLTLKNATINVPSSAYKEALRVTMNSLVISCQGTNQVTTNSNGAYDAFGVMGSATITGSGTIKFKSAYNDGISFSAVTTVNIQDGVKVEATGQRYGVNGNSVGVIALKGANTKLTATGSTASYFKTPTSLYDGLAITAPAGAMLNSAGTVISSASGAVIKNQAVVFSKPAYQVGDVDLDGSVNISDVTALIDILLSGGNTTNADVDLDGSVNISDVTTLIDMLLGNH